MKAMCGVQLKDNKGVMDVMVRFGLNGGMEQLYMANSMHWYGDVLWREDGHVLIRTGQGD